MRRVIGDAADDGVAGGASHDPVSGQRLTELGLRFRTDNLLRPLKGAGEPGAGLGQRGHLLGLGREPLEVHVESFGVPFGAHVPRHGVLGVAVGCGHP